jgi:hypothetical protein
MCYSVHGVSHSKEENMNGLTLSVTTHLYGLGSARETSPTYVLLPEEQVCPPDLVAAHVQAEILRAQANRDTSLALHYMLADDVRQLPAEASIDMAAEISRAQDGLIQRRFMLVVDGEAINDFDTPLALTPQSRVAFVRLLPLIGG